MNDRSGRAILIQLLRVSVQYPSAHYGIATNINAFGKSYPEITPGHPLIAKFKPILIFAGRPPKGEGTI
jgi:hypothetical protein